MAVEPENYEPEQVAVLKRKAAVVSVKRGRNGSWKVTADLEIKLRLPDGRIVTAWEEVRLRGRGQPKPRPDPTWLYEGKRGRARKRGKNGRD